MLPLAMCQAVFCYCSNSSTFFHPKLTKNTTVFELSDKRESRAVTKREKELGRNKVHISLTKFLIYFWLFIFIHLFAVYPCNLNSNTINSIKIIDICNSFIQAIQHILKLFKLIFHS